MEDAHAKERALRACCEEMRPYVEAVIGKPLAEQMSQPITRAEAIASIKALRADIAVPIGLRNVASFFVAGASMAYLATQAIWPRRLERLARRQAVDMIIDHDTYVLVTWWIGVLMLMSANGMRIGAWEGFDRIRIPVSPVEQDMKFLDAKTAGRILAKVSRSLPKGRVLPAGVEQYVRLYGRTVR